MPDDLYSQAKQPSSNVSQLAQRAVAAALDRMAKIAALDRYRSELDAEHGPTSDSELADATAWADQIPGRPNTQRPA